MKSALRFSVTFLVALVMTARSPAAADTAERKEGAQPAIVLQVKSIDELLDSVKAAANNFMPAPMHQEFEKEFLGKLDLNLIKGVDTKKPIGLYASIGEEILQGDFSKSSLVLVVPVSDEKAFVELLSKNLRVDKKGDEYAVQLPNVPVAASLRFLKGYAYIGATTGTLDVKDLLSPSELFGEKQPAAATLRIRLDRLPVKLKQQFLAAYTQNMERLIEAAKVAAAGAPPGHQRVRAETEEQATRLGLRWIKLLIGDGQELAFRVDLDPKTCVLTNEMSVRAKPGSVLAKSISDLQPTTNDFIGIVGPDSTAHVLIKAPLFIDEIKTALAKLIETATGILNSPKEEREMTAALCQAFGHAVSKGDLDFAVDLRGPDQNNQFTAIGAVNLKDAAALEKPLRSFVKNGPKDAREMIKLDAFKVADINVHELAVGDTLPAELRKAFGTGPMFVAVGPQGVFLTLGPQGKEVMKDVLTRKLSPKPAPLVAAAISAKRVAAFFKTVGAPPEAFEFLDKLAVTEQSTVIAITIKGGDKLVLRTELGLPALFILAPKGVAKPMVQTPAPKVQPIAPPRKQ